MEAPHAKISFTLLAPFQGATVSDAASSIPRHCGPSHCCTLPVNELGVEKLRGLFS